MNTVFQRCRCTHHLYPQSSIENATDFTFLLLWPLCIHLIQKRLSSELLHTKTAMHHGCNKFAHCCMTRPQSIVVHIASMATTRMLLSHAPNSKSLEQACSRDRTKEYFFVLSTMPRLHACIQKPGASMELRQLQCYLKIRYINGALRSGYTTMCNAQCNNSEDNLFWIRCIIK